MATAHRYLRVVHRVQGIDAPDLRDAIDAPGPVIIISNHTSAIDAFLIQCAARRPLRWFMAADMMVSFLRPLWKYEEIIPVYYDARDGRAAVEAIRHLRAGNGLALFPEGGIERPAQRVKPFQGGFATFAVKTGARIVVCAVDGTPTTTHPFAAMFMPSRARIRLVSVHKAPTATEGAALIETIRREIAATLGWPLDDIPLEHLR